LDPGIFYSSRNSCEYCQKTHKDNCPFAFKDNTTMRQVLSKIQFDRDFELLESIDFQQHNLSQSNAQSQKSSKGGISIYDCLSWFN
jgi:ubiquitin C-terminal hydrolase